jgi:hypothetical protein
MRIIAPVPMNVNRRVSIAGMILISVLSGFSAQCDLSLEADTMSFPGGKVLEGGFLESTAKNGSVFRLFKTENGHIYLRMILTRNFYFDKTDLLEIRSGKLSYYEKNATQHKKSKTEGLMIIEISPNYLATLRDHGITSVVFAGAETRFNRQDAGKIRKMAGCLYEASSEKPKRK